MFWASAVDVGTLGTRMDVRAEIGKHEQGVPSFVETGIPARLDRVPWGRFYTLVVVALCSRKAR